MLCEQGFIMNKMAKIKISASISTDVNNLFDYLCGKLNLDPKKEKVKASITKDDVKMSGLIRFLENNKLDVDIRWSKDIIIVHPQVDIEQTETGVVSEKGEDAPDWMDQ